MQAAVAHAQFETIHPFADGNGRVGRCLVQVVLRRRGVASSFVPPVSLILASDAHAYVRGLTDFRGGHVADWCALFAQATRTAAAEAGRFAEAIEALKVRWGEAAGRPRRNSAARGLLDLLPSQPILDVGTAQRLLGRSNQAARLAMLQLARAGVVKPITTGRRNRAWEAVGLFDLLNAFELELASRRARRRPKVTAPRA
jgi:Fic family protein